MLLLITHEQTLAEHKNIEIWEWLKDFCTVHMIRTTMVLSFI